MSGGGLCLKVDPQHGESPAQLKSGELSIFRASRDCFYPGFPFWAFHFGVPDALHYTRNGIQSSPLKTVGRFQPVFGAIRQFGLRLSWGSILMEHDTTE